MRSRAVWARRGGRRTFEPFGLLGEPVCRRLDATGVNSFLPFGCGRDARRQATLLFGWPMLLNAR
jgi:hypothetical protein